VTRAPGQPDATAQAGPAFPSFFQYDAKVLRGKNGRLFLDNDTNRVVDQFTGALRFTDAQLVAWRRRLDDRCASLEALGVPYLFLVPPNAYPVYPEDLPDHIRPAPRRPVHQLIEHLQTNGSRARLIYPLEELLAAKPDPLLYAKTDTHWSARGAWHGYKALVDAIGSAVAINPVAEDDVEFRERPWMGELGFKTDPKEESVLVTARVLRPEAVLVSDNRVYNRGMTVVTECGQAPPTRCLLFGDSFALASLPFFAASFGRFVFVHSPTLDLDFVEQERPDVVISMMNERFLMTVPDDEAAPSIREIAEEKVQNGMLRDAELAYWPRATTEER
jgi:alginate O-acetyltransferase complex protein AlgJ